MYGWVVTPSKSLAEKSCSDSRPKKLAQNARFSFESSRLHHHRSGRNRNSKFRIRNSPLLSSAVLYTWPFKLYDSQISE